MIIPSIMTFVRCNNTLLYHRSEVVTWKFSSQHTDSCTVLLYQVIHASEQFLVCPIELLLTSLRVFHCHVTNSPRYTDSKLRITVCGDLRVHIFQWCSEFEMMEDIAQIVVIFRKPLMRSKKKYKLKKIQIQLPKQHHETECPAPQDEQWYRQSYILLKTVFFHVLCEIIVTAKIPLYKPNNTKLLCRNNIHVISHKNHLHGIYICTLTDFAVVYTIGVIIPNCILHTSIIKNFHLWTKINFLL